MMTFLYLKVHNDCANFPLVQFSLPHQVGFRHLCTATVKTFMRDDLSAVYPTSHLCVVLHFLIL